MKIEIKDEIKYRDWLFRIPLWRWRNTGGVFLEEVEPESLLPWRKARIWPGGETVEGFAETNGMSPKLEMGKREKESDGGPGAKGSVTVSLVQC